jgi:hypothetical protein
MAATLHQNATVFKAANIVVEVEKSSLADNQMAPATEKNGDVESVPATVFVQEGEHKIQDLAKEAESAPSAKSVTPTTSAQSTLVEVVRDPDIEKTTSSSPALVPEPPIDQPKQSAWARFRENLAHDPLNEPEFVNAYNDWKKRNRKERYDRRRAWVAAHGYKLGRLFRLADAEKSKEAWAAYEKKLAYMED